MSHHDSSLLMFVSQRIELPINNWPLGFSSILLSVQYHCISIGLGNVATAWSRASQLETNTHIPDRQNSCPMLPTNADYCQFETTPMKKRRRMLKINDFVRAVQTALRKLMTESRSSSESMHRKHHKSPRKTKQIQTRGFPH